MTKESDEMTVKIVSWIVAGAIGAVVLPVLILPLVFWDAFVLQKLWQWFLLPLGFPAITFGRTAGVLLVIRFATRRGADTKEKTTGTDWAIMLTFPAMVLFFGWIIKWWLL